LSKVESKVYSITRAIVLVDISGETAIMTRSLATRKRGFDRMLCYHVYFQFCSDCPQYRCKKRDV